MTQIYDSKLTHLLKQEPENDKPWSNLLMDQSDYIQSKAFCLEMNTTKLQRVDKLGEDICQIKNQ